MGPSPLVRAAPTENHGVVLAAGTSKRVFQAVANTLREDGQSLVSALKLRSGWGDVVYVRVHTPLSFSQREELASLQAAIEEALGGQRHRVEIIWESFG
jgi:hypothetical protein